MTEKVNINHEYIKWLGDIALDLITNKIEDRPEDAPIFMATNNLLNKLNYNKQEDFSKIFGDDLIEIILDELKSNM